MGMVAGEEEGKTQLAREICELSARAIACSKLHHPLTNKSPFVNWYLVLRVDENADIYSIRKQYHKLGKDYALQLHPDKNKHSKAETAFKLVSEAYYCLSDAAKRRAFDSKIKTNSCIKCNTLVPYINADPPRQVKPKQSRIQRRIRELRTKLMDEAAIIHKCLIANTAASVKLNGMRTETPVFNPSNYQYKGYPHHRAVNHKKLQDFRAEIKIGNRWMHNTPNYESPIFEYPSRKSSFISRCTSTRDH